MRSYPTTHTLWRAVWRTVGFAQLIGCHVYNAELIPRERSSATAVDTAAAGTPALAPMPGSTESTEPETEGPRPDDPPTTQTTKPAPSSESDAGADAETVCGDGRVSGVEKCDVAIALDRPGACPKSCPRLEACAPRVLNNTACQAECVLREPACEGGDECCPGKCTSDNDPDCAGRCGDGIVQVAIGETCEPDSEWPCAASCDDDDDCTSDVLAGSADTCNTKCTHEPIATKPGDGCCSSGATSLDDQDCPPKCGNRVREGNEACDGEHDCGPNCQPLPAGEKRTLCMDGAKTPCERCACLRCTDQELACRMSGDSQSNQACLGVLACSQTNSCPDHNTCYCGQSLLCVLPPFGACKETIDQVAGGDNVDQALRQANDPSTPLGRAAQADDCRVAECRDVCR